jgi:hypothetical protein
LCQGCLPSFYLGMWSGTHHNRGAGGTIVLISLEYTVNVPFLLLCCCFVWQLEHWLAVRVPTKGQGLCACFCSCCSSLRTYTLHEGTFCLPLTLGSLPINNVQSTLRVRARYIGRDIEGCLFSGRDCTAFRCVHRYGCLLHHIALDACCMSYIRWSPQS